MVAEAKEQIEKNKDNQPDIKNLFPENKAKTQHTVWRIGDKAETKNLPYHPELDPEKILEQIEKQSGKDVPGRKQETPKQEKKPKAGTLPYHPELDPEKILEQIEKQSGKGVPGRKQGTPKQEKKPKAGTLPYHPELDPEKILEQIEKQSEKKEDFHSSEVKPDGLLNKLSGNAQQIDHDAQIANVRNISNTGTER